MSHLECLSRVSFDLGIFARVARQKLRRTFVYLLLLVVLSTASATVSLMMKLRQAVRWLEPHLDEIPTITIRDGRASADVEQPWVKRLGTDDKGHAVVAIIDTTGQRRDFDDNEIGVFLKRTELAIKFDGETRLIPLSRVPDTTIGPDVVRGFIKTLMRKVPLYAAAFLLVYFALAVAYAILGAQRASAPPPETPTL